MAVNRKLDYYVKTYGEAEGKARFDKAVKSREKKALRTAAGRASDPHATYTAQDVANGDAITCLECGEHKTFLQWTHFAYQCTGNVKTISEYRAKYPNAELSPRNQKAKKAITLENMIALYGKEDGVRRWDEYRAKQAYTNTFEHKRDKYGWTRKEFDEYNASRAVTKKNLIKKHGVEKGTAMWDSYVERQRYTCSLEYFIEEYGEEEGKKIYDDWSKARIKSTQSKVESEFCDKLDTLFSDLDLKNSRQFVIGNDGVYLAVDYRVPGMKKLIEFYGDYWHANPEKYKAGDKVSSNRTAQQVWDKDAAREKIIKDHGYEVMIVWEKDWRKDEAAVLQAVWNWVVKRPLPPV